MKNIFLLTFNNVREKYEYSFIRLHTNFLFCFFLKREQLAAVAAIANHQRLPIPAAPVVDDPDVNVVDLDDGIEREEKSTSGTTSVSCQESFNSVQ